VAGEHLEQADVVLVELVQPELGDDDHGHDSRPERERHDHLRLVDRVGAREDACELAVRGVPDQQRLAGLRDPPGDSFADLARQDLQGLARLARELADERDRADVVPFDERHAAVVVVDQRAQLGRDHRADLLDVVEPIELAAEALQHFHVRNGAHVARGGDRLARRPLHRAVLVQDDLVLAARLRAHHRGLGAGDQLARVHRVLRPARQADRDGDATGRIEVGRFDAIDDPVRELLCVLRRARRDHDRELLAAQPVHGVGRADGVLQGLRKPAQDLVTGAVAVDVVDALEVVDVEHEHGDGLVRPARVGERPAQSLVERAVVVEAGQRIRHRLVLEAGADLRVVESERRRVTEALRQLELVVVERRFFAEPVDVECALDRVACDQGDRDHRLGLVVGRAGNGRDARIEVRLVDARRLPVLDAPAGQADAEGAFVGEDLVRPLVARPHRDEQAAGLVRLVDRQRVVRDQVGQRVGDAVEQRVEALLAEDVVEDVSQAPIGLDDRVV
jgi:hypothetical protein